MTPMVTRGHAPRLSRVGLVLFVGVALRTPQMMERPLFNDALEPQLGLKLGPAQGPVEMLIVESAERPVDN
jgi:uncharacterized protein (TIGR03435 family)